MDCTAPGAHGIWANLIMPYVNNVLIFDCPTRSWPWQWQQWPVGYPWTIAYGYYSFLGGFPDSGSVADPPGTPIPLGRIAAPASCVALADAWNAGTVRAPVPYYQVCSADNKAAGVGRARQVAEPRFVLELCIGRLGDLSGVPGPHPHGSVAAQTRPRSQLPRMAQAGAWARFALFRVRASGDARSTRAARAFRSL